MSVNDANLVHKESLMHEINALFAPPTAESLGKKSLIGIPSVRRARKANDNTTTSTENNSTNGKVQNLATVPTGNSNKEDPFWKKPRANCHEYCDSCGCIEGERLVCDRCPASFHLECLDPPVEPDEAPTSVWFCHRCSMILRDEEDRTSTSSSQTTIPNEGGSGRSNRQTSSKKSDNHSAFSSSGTNSVSHYSGKRPHPSKSLILDTVYEGRSSRSTAWGESAYVADVEESDLRALWTVIRYASYQNPKEFELPKDLLPGIKLPGSYKTIAERKQKSIIELENGVIPRPVRRCFVCAKTCFFAPLLPCDYCTSCFHLECLDPPLPHFPPRSDRWMCPNHIEHIADRYLVRSIRLTERMRVWSKLADLNSLLPGPSSSSLSSLTQSTSQTGTDDPTKLEDSESILDDEHDDDDDELDPNEFENQEDEEDNSQTTNPIPPYELIYGPDEEGLILADLMRMVQRSRAERTASNAATAAAGSAASAALDTMLITDRTKSSSPPRQMWHFNRVSNRNRWNTNSVDSRQLRIVVPEAVKSMYQRRVRKIPRLNEHQTTNPTATESKDEDENVFVRGLLEFYLKNTMDSNGTNSLTELQNHSLCENHKPEPAATKSADDKSLPNQNTEMKSNELIDPNCDRTKPVMPESTELVQLVKDKLTKFRNSTDLANLDPQLVYSLASERIRQILGHDPHLVAQSGQTTENFTNQTQSVSEHPIRARAIFTPCDGTLGPTVCMRYRQFTIGTSPTCHLCLGNFKPSNTNQCRFISSHHATIFFDDWTRHYELINYSEYGTRVDGITYGNDTTLKSIYLPKPTELVNRVRNLIDESALTNSAHPTNKYSGSISELHHSPPKRFMMMGPRHQDWNHQTSDCHCTSMDVGFGSVNHSDQPTNRLCPKFKHSSNDSDLIASWEGPAVLRHGSVIEFGCYKFVLGLVDRALVMDSTLPSSFIKSDLSHSTTHPTVAAATTTTNSSLNEESHDTVKVCS